jgi:hypothetical protein
VTLAQTVDALRAWLIESSGETLSRVIFDARMIPRRGTEDSVSIHLRSHRDMGVLRGRGRVRYEGVLRIGIVQEIKQSDHTVSEALLLDRVEAFIAACGPDHKFPAERMEFTSAIYSMLPGNEYMHAQLDMRVEFDLVRSEAAA